MARRSIYLSLLAGCALGLAACGMPGSSSGDAPSIYNTSSTEKMGPPPPFAAKTEAAGMAAASSAKTPDALPADTSWADHKDKSAAVTLPVPSGDPLAADTAPPVRTAEASTADTDVNRRIDRLEKEVAEMHNDMNMMMPALTKLVAAQQDLQQILARMDTAAGDPTVHIDSGADKAAMPGNPRNIGPDQQAAVAGTPPDATIDMGPAAEKPETKPLAHDDVPPPDAAAGIAPAQAPAEGLVLPAPAQPAAYAVSQIRFGEHSNMTRIVLDASGKVPYSYALDGSGTLMTLHLPQTDWRTASSAVPASSKLVDSYSATPDGQGGYLVAVKLKQPVSVSWANIMPPGTDSGYRVVFDLTPKG
jgi:hypothetical protein